MTAKWIGVGVLFAVCCGYGFWRAEAYSRRTKILHDLCAFFETAEKLMLHGAMQTAHLTETALHAGNYYLLRDTASGQEQILMLSAELTPNEQESVRRFFDGFGCENAEREQDKVQQQAQLMRLHWQAAQEKENQNKRLAQVLGVCAGGVLTLLML